MYGLISKCHSSVSPDACGEWAEPALSVRLVGAVSANSDPVGCDSAEVAIVAESDGQQLTLMFLVVFCPLSIASCAKAAAASNSIRAKAEIEVLKTVVLVEFLNSFLLNQRL